MVRKDRKSERANKEQSKIQNKLKNTKSKKKSFVPSEIQTRITRLQAKNKNNNNSPKNLNSQNTCTKSDENTLSVLDFSPRKTRSKSEKIQSIAINCNSNEEKSRITTEKKQQQTKISVRSSFVKISAFKVDSIVLAKQKYSLPWPAKVLQIEKERVFVYFYGDKRSGYVAKSEIYDYHLSLKVVKLAIESKKNPLTYRTGVVEVEKLMGIPSELSVFNQQ